jgi:hypothetical protein
VRSWPSGTAAPVAAGPAFGPGARVSGAREGQGRAHGVCERAALSGRFARKVVELARVQSHELQLRRPREPRRDLRWRGAAPGFARSTGIAATAGADTGTVLVAAQVSRCWGGLRGGPHR